MKKVLSLLISLTLFTSCNAGGYNSDKNLCDVYKDYFTIGAAVNEYNMNGDLMSHFNSITAENAMKWLSVHPSLESYTYSAADKYIERAKELGIGVRGHALVWHNEKALPSVFTHVNNQLRSKDDYLALQAEHVRQVVTHFKDDVYCWDVCNEVIDDGVSPLKEDGSNIYRESDLYKIAGRDFILEAYRVADKTLKDLGIRDKVKLYYNDYDNTKQAKRDKTVAMLNWLISENAPIDGIGLQCHYHLGSFDAKALEESIEIYSSLGLDVQITEFDVDIYDRTLAELNEYKLYSDVPESILKLHGSIYDRAFEVFRRQKDKISNVTFWGVADNVCYMNDNEDYDYLTNYPFLFDVAERKKPAFYLITDYKDE